jgi:hypothetical protein
MKPSESDFYLQMVNHLNRLEDEEYSDNPDDVPLFDPTQISPIKDEPKVKLYLSPDFKNFLKSYAEKRTGKKKEKISNKFSEKIYRKMYEANVLPNEDINLFTKVLYHPDVSTTDYTYIREKIANFPKYIIYNEIGLFTLMGFAFFKSSFGLYAKTNPIIGATIMGLAPMTVLLGTQQLNSFMLNRRMKDLSLDEKYKIKNV